MKINAPVNTVETLFPEGVSLYSRTNLKGVIEEVNDAFLHASAFSREELIGKSHNIVRHPEMPTDAFEDMWRDIKAGRPWRGIVKNWRKDGGFYWVAANVSPVRNNDGSVKGYQSVRLLPLREEVDNAQDAYKRIMNGDKSIHISHGRVIEKNSISKFLLSDSFAWCVVLACAIFPSISMVFDFWNIWISIISITSCFLFFSLFVVGYFSAIQGLISWLEKILHTGDLRHSIPRVALNNNRFLPLANSLSDYNYSMRATVTGMEDIAKQIAVVVNETKEIVSGIFTASNYQNDATSSSAAAIEQISVSVGEVAEQTELTKNSAIEAGQEAKQALLISEDAILKISNLSSFIHSTAGKINALGRRSEDISLVISLIKDIADQTNLLALNAAIEAARAGEQGRGFAVVADEVRKLAERTSKATEEIGDMISAIRDDSQAAVEAMSIGEKHAIEGVHSVENVGVALKKICSNMDSTVEMALGIAHSTAEQRTGITNLANDIEKISIMIESNVSTVTQAKFMTEKLELIGKRMIESTMQYRT